VSETADDRSAFPIWPESPSARRLAIPDDLALSPELQAELMSCSLFTDLQEILSQNADSTRSGAAIEAEL
jgi:hypothetical protein